MIRILFIGDIVGRPGRKIVSDRVRRLRVDRGIHLVIANGENAAAGAGITGAIARSLFESGIDAITLGDHVWDQKGWDAEIDGFSSLCRPANLPVSCPGRDHVILKSGDFLLGVFTVLGRQYVNLKSDCPFLAAERMIGKLQSQCDTFFVEMHAEVTSEKQAMGWHLDGRVAAVIGTHTHVPTADACVLPKGTAFMCDAGMTGPYDSVLGRDRHAILGRFLDGMPRRCEVAEGDVRLSGALIDYDPAEKRAVRVEHMMLS